MTIYFCPNCDRKYSTANLHRISCDPQKYNGDDVSKYFMCSCGFQGSLWPDTEEGRISFIDHLKHQVRYLDEFISHGIFSLREDRLKLIQKLKKVTGEDIRQEKRKSEIKDAFAKWSVG